jgi:hypothetical protein
MVEMKPYKHQALGCQPQSMPGGLVLLLHLLIWVECFCSFASHSTFIFWVLSPTIEEL